MMKFKIGFTVTTETLFNLLATVLPIEDLHVEEVREYMPSPQRKLARQLVHDLPKLRHKRQSRELNLYTGINKIIMTLFADGEPHKAIELRPLLINGGFSFNSVTSRLIGLERHGVVEHLKNGTWRLKPMQEESA